MFNRIFFFLLASIMVLIDVFAYTKYNVKKSQETESVAETERKLMIAEKEREKVRRMEEMGYSERDERDEYDDSDNNGE